MALHSRSGSLSAIDLHRLAFVDVETTGLDPMADRVAEIGVVTVDGETTTEWGTFVASRRGAGPRPPRAIPGSVAALPDAAPTFSDVAAELEQRLAGRLLIAHNARFDYAFLKAEFERVGIAFDAEVVCTVMLSRRLYPGRTAHDLDALIDRCGLTATDRHRALPDARALAACWFAIAREKGCRTLADAVSQLLTGPVLPAHLDPALIDRLPESPGAYAFHAACGEVLRIGVARSLRAHLTSYFSLDRASPRALAIAQQIETIAWRSAQGPLGARLQAIALANATRNHAKFRPARALTWRASPDRRPILELVTIHGESLAASAPELFGAFASERSARNALIRVSRRHALCHALLGIPSSTSMRCPACDDGSSACGEKTQRLRHLVKCFGALRPLRIAPWPYPSPIVVRERRDLHVFDEWRHLGTMRTESEALEAVSARPGEFDSALYACLVRSLPRLPPDRIHLLQSPGWASISDNISAEAKAKEKRPTARVGLSEFPGGDEEDRTPDLRIANAALSQLSYVPDAKKYSRSAPPA